MLKVVDDVRGFAGAGLLQSLTVAGDACTLVLFGLWLPNLPLPKLPPHRPFVSSLSFTHSGKPTPIRLSTTAISTPRLLFFSLVLFTLSELDGFEASCLCFAL
jgi:hypothetical protein